MEIEGVTSQARCGGVMQGDNTARARMWCQQTRAGAGRGEVLGDPLGQEEERLFPGHVYRAPGALTGGFREGPSTHCAGPTRLMSLSHVRTSSLRVKSRGHGHWVQA